MLMGNDIKETFKVRLNVEGVNTSLMMVLILMGIGKMTQQMVKGKKFILIKVILLVVGKMINRMERVFFVKMEDIYYKIGKWEVL